jgi:hypothetical protein
VRSVAKHPCKASFFAGVFFCLVRALALPRLDVLPEIVQGRVCSASNSTITLTPSAILASSLLHHACPSLQRQLAVRYNRQQFP